MRKHIKQPILLNYLGPEDRWRALGVAIVKQAVVDWQESKLLLANPVTSSKAASDQKRSAEHFLSSSLCEFYSGLDGKTIMRKLKEKKL